MAHFVFHRHYRQRFCDNVSHSFFGSLTDCTIYQSAKASLIPNVILLATSRKTGSRLLVVYFFLLPQQFKVDINLFLPDRHYNDFFLFWQSCKKSNKAACVKFQAPSHTHFRNSLGSRFTFSLRFRENFRPKIRNNNFRLYYSFSHTSDNFCDCCRCLLSSSKAHSVVCVSVSVLDTRVDCAKTYKAIVNQFENPRNHVLDGSAQRRSQSVHGSDAALCQITLTSCYLLSFRTVDIDVSPMSS